MRREGRGTANANVEARIMGRSQQFLELIPWVMVGLIVGLLACVVLGIHP